MLRTAPLVWSRVEEAFTGLEPTRELLARGGDARIDIDPATGANRYLCPPVPGEMACFGSSTASVISTRGYEAADRLRETLDAACRRETATAVYRREGARLRRELVALCGLDLTPGLTTLLAASGTDIHLILAQLLTSGRRTATFGVAIEACETGSGVPGALRGSHVSNRAPSGQRVVEGQSFGDGLERLVTVAARGLDGRPRAAAAIAAELEDTVERLAIHGHILLTVADLSKTGLLSFDLAQVFELRRRFPDRIDILVDACQFRLSPGALQAYLDRDCLVAVTGSKFLGGPTFSGALFVPATLAARFARAPACPGLSSYAMDGDLPSHWRAAAGLPEIANFGLLLRWEAALEELRALRRIQDWKIARALHLLGGLVRAKLEEDPVFEPLPTPLPDRRILGEANWDAKASIFPFLLRHTEAGRYFSRAQTDAAYRALAGSGLLLGQPVACGERDGSPISALRFCLGAPLLVEAAPSEASLEDVGRGMVRAFEHISAVVRGVGRRG